MITKDELLRGVWADAFVEESNLSQNVSLLRKALDDRGTSPRYIVAVPGKGYQFAATPAVEIAEAIAVGQNIRLQAMVSLPVDEALSDQKPDVSNLIGSRSPAPRPKPSGNSPPPARCSSPSHVAGWPTPISMADIPSPSKALRRTAEPTAVP